MMERINLKKLTDSSYRQGKRLVAPLLGFPGIPMVNSNIKLAQQNYGEHYKVIEKLVATYLPDVIFPLMDLSVEANATGRYTIFPVDDSATVPKDQFSIEDLPRLKSIDIQMDTRLFGYIKTMRIMNERLPAHIVRGAYVTGPYTLAALIMGADDAAMATLMDTDSLHHLARFATDIVQKYVSYYIDVGAQLICILDPTAVMLGPDQFWEFSGKYAREIVRSCAARGVATVYHICGNSMHLIDKMTATGVNGLSLDSREAGIDIVKVLKRVPSEVVVMGNISPVETIMNGTPDDVKREVEELLGATAQFPNYILSTGCDLPQNVPPENIRAFITTGRDYNLG